MKAVAGLALAMVVMLVIQASLGAAREFSSPHDGSIRVVPGTARPGADHAPAAAPRPAVAAVAVMPTPPVTLQRNSDADVMAELFEAQLRDPAWAPGAEAEIRAHLPAGGTVRCGALTCRVAMPLPDRSMATSADRQADLVSRRWSDGLPYNRLTATVVGDGQAPTLRLYATRADADAAM